MMYLVFVWCGVVCETEGAGDPARACLCLGHLFLLSVSKKEQSVFCFVLSLLLPLLSLPPSYFLVSLVSPFPLNRDPRTRGA